VDNTGLLAQILEPFERRTGLTTQVLAVGSGQALALARNGDVDLVLTHDPDAEREFVRQGFGVFPVEIMHNDFVVVGPTSDPASVRNASSPAKAFQRIAGSKTAFVSRGDRSGTHLKELGIWEQAGIQPSGAWYLEAGQGQRLTLEMASQKQGYVLVDRATWDFSQGALELELLYENPEALHNSYTAIAVSPLKNPAANIQDAMALMGWMVSQEGQKIIGDYRVDSRSLFVPEVRFQP
jgi:tungstate transport system substrate-binding protein